MPCLTDPEAEARRVALVRAAVALRKPWLESTGPRSVRGKRATAQNRLSHGAYSLSLRAAITYCDAVEVGISNLLRQSLIIRPHLLACSSPSQTPHCADQHAKLD